MEYLSDETWCINHRLNWTRELDFIYTLGANLINWIRFWIFIYNIYIICLEMINKS